MEGEGLGRTDVAPASISTLACYWENSRRPHLAGVLRLETGATPVLLDFFEQPTPRILWKRLELDSVDQDDLILKSPQLGSDDLGEAVFCNVAIRKH